jgi:hypothetical protein
MLDMFDEDDDVQDVYHNVELPDGDEERIVKRQSNIVKCLYCFLLFLKHYPFVHVYITEKKMGGN